MENEQINLNTEPNDIAGNHIDGPVGNTAAKPGLPGAGMGLPGGPPTPEGAAPSATPDVSSPAAPASSESLAASEISVGEGAVDADPQPQENKEANPADLAPTGAYGGNFSNSTQNSYRDPDRRENQDSDPNRGEFGVQDAVGTTHGGFGNQNRLADYEPRDSAEDRYYGGPGAASLQDNAYRAYDGRNERPDRRTNYGFEPGATPAATSADAAAAHQNDNGSPKGPDRGYASDYGHTSLPAADSPRHSSQSRNNSGSDHRNQSEDYLPAQSETDSQGRHSEQRPGYSSNFPEMADQRGPGEGYGDKGRTEPPKAPDFRTGDARNGYVQPQANNGDVAQGVGSRGGSYNDIYDDSHPGSKTGLPAKGDERREDTDRNYGEAARAENRPADGDGNTEDHGTPHRNDGRDDGRDE